MGCNSSKDNVNVLANNAPTSQAWTEERNAENTSLNSKPNSADSRSKSGRSKMVRMNSKNNVKVLEDGGDRIITDRSASQYSLRSETDGKRGTSATSKVSTHTFDSGLEEDFLPNMITEDSDPEKQRIAGERPPTPGKFQNPLFNFFVILLLEKLA